MNAHIMRSGRALLPLALLVSVSASVEAIPINYNLSFENGLDGYNPVKGTVSVVTESYFWDDTSYDATDGDWFARLETAGPSNDNGNGDNRASLSTFVDLNGSQTLSFDWIFLGSGADPYLVVQTNEAIPFADILEANSASVAGWNTSSWSPGNKFNGKIEFVVSDSKGSADSPILLLDNLRISGLPAVEQPGVTSVPEPNILALCGLGLLVLGTRRRLNRKE